MFTMLLHMKTLIYALGAFLFLLPDVSLATPPNWLRDYAADTQSQARMRNIPGYVFVFVKNGDTPIVYTYGQTERNGAPIDADTVFRLASVSKTFTGVLMAKLVEQEQMSWQTSIPQLVPKYGFQQQPDAAMNLEHLLSQSSGFTPNAYDNLIEANYSLKRVLSQLAKLKPLCSPGRCYTYQNALFGVLEDYYQDQKTSYGQILENQLLRPLKMPHASAGRDGLVGSDKWAKPHIAITRDKWRQGKVQQDYYRFTPAAGVNASISDMVIWIKAMLGQYPNVVSPNVIETVTTPRVKTQKELRRRDWRQFLKDAHYGLGWRIYDFQGHKLNYHGGWVEGYRADVAFAPEQGVGFAMLMNAESNLINSFTAKFWETYFKQVEKAQQTAELSAK